MLAQSPLLLALFAFTVASQKFGWVEGPCTPEQDNECSLVAQKAGVIGGCRFYGDINHRDRTHVCIRPTYCRCDAVLGNQLFDNKYGYTCGCERG
ncbi:hypothetical protein PTNB73_00040 [Pyrenophora teres f. teres]|nr:hypothetical protein HRS9139_01284 [Pyrenophora teres f. teres]KAE8850946.1 hypothetical protein PTNB85_01362 [Pyrenophora teres f. teres]KAE8851022.1 hypothetical protein HRS9122_01309 [Pyrenophora teres f. teres]KAE8869695.1 hypothetical protein PTNB29_00039 [Pyrenophora teres f. teres]KAE8873408.1 hypothetical protein PTNB73_00040 [Pyrenophora teres f. teres]